jgi:hypothetical protein
MNGERSEFRLVQFFYSLSDQFSRDSFRFWLTHVLYNFVKDACYLLKIRKF